MRLRALDERGLTLTEVTIVAAIGMLVLMTMGGFYLTSQATWLDASAQAITQREVTMVTQAIVDSVRVAAAVTVNQSPDTTHWQLGLARKGNLTHYYFWWDENDSLLHAGSSPGASDDHAMIRSPVERFIVEQDGNMIRVRLQARASTGKRVEFSGTARMRNS